MVLNELKSKTKELVFHRLCPRRCHVGSPIDGIEQVTHCKLLGIIVQDTFSVDMHVNYILSICSQRSFFLMKRMRDQGLPVKHLNTVFLAVIVSRLLYALPSWGCFLTADLSGKIDAFLRRAHRYGLSVNISTVSELFDSVAQDFFSKIQSPDHCLHSVLPEEKTSSLALRPRRHQFQLPTCIYRLLIYGFVNHFKFVGYRGGSHTAVQAWQPCPLWEPSPSHPILV